MQKLLVICGPTATGKTDLAILLAHHFDGEIVSADSRQVFQGMDIGTGKDIDNKSKIVNQNAKLHIEHEELTVGYRCKNGIPVWLVDIVKPDYRFNVGEYQEIAKKVIEDISKRQQLPIVVGGTGLYIKALIEPLSWIGIPIDSELRQRLEGKTVEQLQQELKTTDTKRWEIMNESDRRNSRRLIRALEIGYSIKHVAGHPHKENDILFIGLTASPDVLKANIEKRVDKRLSEGIIDEIKSLLKKGYSWELSSMSGLGYREWKEYIENIRNLSDTIELWKLHEIQYVRRQLTWFKKQMNIEWFSITVPDFRKRIVDRVRVWYNT